MSGKKKIIPSIYRIDLEKIKYHLDSGDSEEILPSTAHSYILEYSDKQRKSGSKSQPYKMKSDLIEINNFSIAIYGTESESVPHLWKSLFDLSVDDLMIQNLNLAAFISQNQECYAISAGKGYALFEQFIDTQFPLEVAKRIMKPEMKGTESREIAGAIYGQVQQYRTSQMIISSQNLGTVWRALEGQVTDEIKTSGEFKLIFNPDRRPVNIEAGSALTIKRSISLSKLLDCLNWLNELLDKEPTPQQEENFQFLNDIKEVSLRNNKGLITELRKKLGQDILEKVRESRDIDFDFSHVDFLHYKDADTYCFEGENGGLGSTPPSATDVIYALDADDRISDCQNGEEVAKLLKNTIFHSVIRDSPQNSLNGSVLNHLHGEVAHDNSKFFLIDGKWYEAQSGFMERLNKDFSTLIAKEEFFPSAPNVPFSRYNHLDEGNYNESYQHNTEWLVADKVFVSNVEIADLFHWRDDKLYIIHNKKGFGVTTRDVCSQILHSMNIINRIRNSESEVAVLEQYFDRIKKRYYNSDVSIPLKKNEFIDRIRKTKSSDITFVVGYIDGSQVHPNIGSNIAKFESVKLCSVDKRAFDFNLEMIHIPKDS